MASINGKSPGGDVSRRAFLSGAAATAALAATGNYAHAQGSDRVRVGLIGCGGRGSGAMRDCVTSSPNVELYAVGDIFPDMAADGFKKAQDLGDKNKVTKDRVFAGWDAYKQVIASGVDMVILTTPPGFRPMHLAAAVEAGKHVFMEKPVAVDAPGVRSVIESSDKAKAKGLGIVAGTQRRHHRGYLETMKRIHDGQIGKVVSAQVYWNQGALWHRGKPAEWTEMEYQVRNWYYHTWLSGDHICEQHIHNLDVANWAIGAHPTKCVGMGGREVRKEEKWGHIFDHFAIEYFYPDDVRVMSMCRQIDGCASNVSEHIIGTKGISDGHSYLRGENRWRFEGNVPPEYVQEHTDLIASFRSGNPLNEGRQVAESTLTAIMGRMSAYTGKEITWEMAMNSQENLIPEKLAWGPAPKWTVAVPGQTRFV